VTPPTIWERLAAWLTRWWKALLAVAAAVLGGVAVLLAGRRGDGDVVDAAIGLAETREKGKAKVAQETDEALARYEAAAQKEKEDRADSLSGLGGYLDDRRR